MVAYDQPLLPVEPLQDRFRFLTDEEHISENTNGTAALNAAVPVLYDCLIHFFYCRKRTVAEL